MRRDGHSPEGRGQDRGAGQDPRGPGAAPAGSARTAAGRRAPPAVPPLHAVLTAALQQRVAQRAARAPASTRPSWVISANAVWMRRRSWCSRRHGAGRWVSVARATTSRPRATPRLTPDVAPAPPPDALPCATPWLAAAVRRRSPGAYER